MSIFLPPPPTQDDPSRSTTLHLRGPAAACTSLPAPGGRQTSSGWSPLSQAALRRSRDQDAQVPRAAEIASQTSSRARPAGPHARPTAPRLGSPPAGPSPRAPERPAPAAPPARPRAGAAPGPPRARRRPAPRALGAAERGDAPARAAMEHSGGGRGPLRSLAWCRSLHYRRVSAPSIPPAARHRPGTPPCPSPGAPPTLAPGGPARPRPGCHARGPTTLAPGAPPPSRPRPRPPSRPGPAPRRPLQLRPARSPAPGSRLPAPPPGPGAPPRRPRVPRSALRVQVYTPVECRGRGGSGRGHLEGPLIHSKRLC